MIAEYENGALPANPTREYIYSGSQLLATIEGSVTKYHHADHLSVRVSTDAAGTKIGEQWHLPFGESWQESGGTKWKFTSYERDGESTLDYAMFRYDSTRLGRFMTPDPIAGSIADPQSLNRYSYARNDPVNLVDPFGLITTCHVWGWDYYLNGQYWFSTVEGWYCVTTDPPKGPRGGYAEAPKPPGLPGFTEQAYQECAQQAFGGTTGNIPGTNHSIPGFEAALAVFQGSLLVGADPATVAGTMAYESNSNLNIATQENPDGSRDVGPMQLNTYWAATGAFPHVYPGSFGTDTVTLPGEPFNGNALANIMTGAHFLRELGAHPERYAPPQLREERRMNLENVDPFFRKFFDCLAKNLSF